jgi:hypothetical protein
MSIKITKSNNGYNAVVTPSPRLPSEWKTEHAMGRRELTENLIELGYHLQDIVDAFDFADLDESNR